MSRNNHLDALGTDPFRSQLPSIERFAGRYIFHLISSTRLLSIQASTTSSVALIFSKEISTSLVKQINSTTMSQKFSNTSTGDAPADPYKKANLDNEASTAQKIQDLTEFVTACKFGMMTTKGSGSGRLVSRCMALAGKVPTHFRSAHLPFFEGAILSGPELSDKKIGNWRHRPPVPHKYRIW